MQLHVVRTARQILNEAPSPPVFSLRGQKVVSSIVYYCSFVYLMVAERELRERDRFAESAVSRMLGKKILALYVTSITPPGVSLSRYRLRRLIERRQNSIESMALAGEQPFPPGFLGRRAGCLFLERPEPKKIGAGKDNTLEGTLTNVSKFAIVSLAFSRTSSPQMNQKFVC